MFAEILGFVMIALTLYVAFQVANPPLSVKQAVGENTFFPSRIDELVCRFSLIVGGQ